MFAGLVLDLNISFFTFLSRYNLFQNTAILSSSKLKERKKGNFSVLLTKLAAMEVHHAKRNPFCLLAISQD